MKRYIWAELSAVYHDREELAERCNTDQLKGRQESDTPPPDKRLCHFCAINGGHGKRPIDVREAMPGYD